MGMLDGLAVLDLSRLLPGPACTAWLAGQGARVDRVETPGRGDFTRHIPPFVATGQGTVGAYFAATAWGVRSIAIDLRSPEGLDLVRRMVPRYDVVVEGFRPGVLESMGLGPEVLHALRPDLVIARLSGYGQTGPWKARVGHDINYVGLSGGLHPATRGPRGVSLPVMQVADMTGALLAAAGIATALVQRERTGKGAVLDVSLAEAALWSTSPVVAGATGAGVDPGPGEHLLSGGLPTYGTFQCADGAWLTLGALEPRFQARLAEHVQGDRGHEALAARMATRTRAEWVGILEEVCSAELLAASEVVDHPQHAARGSAVRVAGTTFVRPPLGELPSTPPPELGGDTDAVLHDAGLGDEIAALRMAGVVA